MNFDFIENEMGEYVNSDPLVQNDPIVNIELSDY